jgi:polyisoprenyl-teichoic acid--peptidoglycan teichoic acid transferase
MAQRRFDLTHKQSAPKRSSIFQLILVGVGGSLAVLLWTFLSGFVACWQVTALPGMPPPTCSASQPTAVATLPGETAPAPTPTPSVSIPEIALPPAWDGASRVTVLILGLRGGDNNQACPDCTDTMILLTVDPVNKTAGMLSIPRDMWVSIPGFYNNRINAAYNTGELYKLPGGGPGLTIKTVENFLGIPIQYYAQIDFTAFEKMIDDIGGICLDVPAKVDVGVLNEHGTTVVEPGQQCLSGKVALGYARARDTGQGVAGGDVERSQNQQRVILAIRDKVLSNLPALVTQAVPLYNEISSGVHTDLSLDDILRLGMLAKDIPLDSIQPGVIDYSMMVDQMTTINGMPAAVLRPFPDKIRELVNKIFGGGTLEPAASGSLTELIQQEAARVLVTNASGISGIDQKTYDYLKAQGLNVIGPGNMADYPDKYRYPPLPTRSMLIVHTGKPYTVKYLMTLMKFDSANQFQMFFDPGAPADIVLVIGADWVKSNPMPQ